MRPDRQIMALGDEGQSVIDKIRVGIVGLGGLGSQIVQQLAHLGVRNFSLIDFDRVEDINLNRIVGACPSDIGVLKVAVSERMIKKITGKEPCDIMVLGVSIRNKKALSALTECDVVFGCIDRDGPRLILNELAKTYNIPYIDLAFQIFAENGIITEAGGRVVIVHPDGPCLLCCKEIDVDEAKQDLSTIEEHTFAQKRGYIEGSGIYDPSIISLDGIIASIAVTEFLALITGFRNPHQYILYDMMRSTVVPVKQTDRSECFHKLYKFSEKGDIFRYCLEHI